MSGQAVVLGRVDDLVEEDGEAVVLSGDAVLLLSEAASVVVRTVTLGRTDVETLAGLLTRIFGSPGPNAARFAREIVNSLVRAGVLAYEEPAEQEKES